MKPPRYVVLFMDKDRVVGVVSQEGFPQIICYPCDDLEKARKYGDMVKQVTTYEPHVYALLETTPEATA